MTRPPRAGEAASGRERYLDLPTSREGAGISYVVVYPNRYTVGMANLGVQSLLWQLFGLPDARCHRAFSDVPLTIEAGRPLANYDVVALSLCFEGDYADALRLLRVGGVPLRSAARGSEHPLVVGGGVGATLNPEPLAPFLDVVFLGEAEAGFERLHRFIAEFRHLPRPEFLERLAEARLPGVYVPSRYEVEEEAGVVVGRTPRGGAPARISRVWAEVPWEPSRSHVVAEDDAFGGAYLLEVSRGCPHACRFCAAGHLTRPARFLSADLLEPFAAYGVAQVGKVGLVGAAVSDHPELARVARGVLAAGGSFSVSSFRAENLNPELLSLMVRGGLQTVTVALEAGTERVRAALGKGISDADLLATARLAGGVGIRNLRIYAMVGLPGEDEEDVARLAELAAEARDALGGGVVTLSVAPFVPKASTPLQWEPMAAERLLKDRIRLLQRLCGRRKGVQAVAETPKWSRVQGLLARAGRSAADALEEASDTGDWRSVLRSELTARALDRAREPQEMLPWDFIDGVPARAHLWRERNAGRLGLEPVTCRPGGCRVCDVCEPR